MSVPLLRAAPDAANVLIAAGGYVLGTGRTVPSVAALLGLISVVIAGLALSRLRSTHRSNRGRRWP